MLWKRAHIEPRVRVFLENCSWGLCNDLSCHWALLLQPLITARGIVATACCELARRSQARVDKSQLNAELCPHTSTSLSLSLIETHTKP